MEPELYKFSGGRRKFRGVKVAHTDGELRCYRGRERNVSADVHLEGPSGSKTKASYCRGDRICLRFHNSKVIER
ncbi:hypothetical protein AOLI_G00004340 [Acnodon oligacanthus]